MRFLSFLFLGLYFLVSCHSPVSEQDKKDPFKRNARLIFTHHARCRMDCRHITPIEIDEIVHKGKINYGKSEPEGRPDPKYALEGYTAEQQHLRIIVAPEEEKLIVVTCMELGVEWACDCN